MPLWIPEIIAREVLPSVDPLATGEYPMLIVAADEYHEYYYLRVSGDAATIDFDRLSIQLITGGRVRLKEVTAARYVIFELNPILPVPPGGMLEINVKTYTAGDKLAVYAFYRRWKLSQA